MKTHSTIAGNAYTVTSPNGGTVTDASGKLSKVVASGDQLTVVAPSEALYCSDDDADIRKANFKYALAALFLLGEGNTLPAGYKRLEYLETTGSQYIACDVQIDADFGLIYDVERWRAAVNTFMLDWQGPSGKLMRIANGWSLSALTSTDNVIWWGQQCGSGVLAARQKWQVNWKNNKQVVFDAEGTHKEWALAAEVAANYPKAIFGKSCVWDSSLSGYATQLPASLRWWSIKMSTGESVKYDLVPALDPTGRPCMFDLVTRTPFHNTGTGQFIVGMTLAQVRGLRLPAGGGELTLALPHEASIDRIAQAALERARANGWTLTLQYAEAEVPAGYRRLEYLESTGTQYIDTGVKLSNESEVRCEFMTVELTGAYQRLYGCFAAPRFACYSAYLEYMAVACYILGDAKRVAAQLGKKITLCHNIEKCIMEGVDYRFNTTPSAFETPLSCQIFNSDSEINNIAHARIYAFSISRAGEMQVDYVPCIAPDGKLGMYNRVDGTVKENAGSGAFIAGLATVDDVRKLWLPETGGPLTVSVPADTPDSAVEQLRKNNPTWQIAIQYRQ